MTLTEFRALASKATPGEWWRRISQTGLCAYLYADGHLLADLHSYTEGPGPDRAQRDANAAWIAAASPTAILALIERLERAEAALRPFAKFDMSGFDGIVLEVVPSDPRNPAPRIEPILADYFRRAAAYFSAPAGEDR